MKLVSERTADSKESVDWDNISKVLSLSSEISELVSGNGIEDLGELGFQIP